MLNDVQKASRDQFDRQAASYGRSHILADTSDVAEGLRDVVRPATGRALDVATGGGHTALWLARAGWQVTAADLAPAMLESAARLAAEEGFTVETSLQAAEDFPQADCSFDLVTCRVAAHHFSDRTRFVQEVFRVLRPGGFFLLIDGSVPDGEPEAEEWIHRIEKLRDPSHGRFVSPSGWRDLCAAAGLRVVRCETRPFKQPDLEWYFAAAATPEANRAAVRELVAAAPDSARRVFQLAEEDGRIVWWWPRLTLLACHD